MPSEPVNSSTHLRDPEAALAALSERLQKAARWTLIAEIVSYISHELNQPLAAMATFAEAGTRLLSETQPDVSRAREVQSEIARQALRAGDLVRRLQLLLGHGGFEPVAINCGSLAREFMGIAGPLARLRAINVRLSADTTLPAVSGDPDLLHFLLLILFHNAVDAIGQSPPERREIVLFASRAGGGVDLGIEDTGHGIREEHRARLFQMFFTTKPNGAGLGLAIASSIAARHGAALQFVRLASHRTRFWVTLPAAANLIG
jgi:two-component system sensor histidine kinase DctS